MCIRDRGISSPEKIGGTYQEALAYPTLNVRGLQAAWVGDESRTIIPVSYTHLRAHETVLDLVCRLLLEKKKTTKKKQKKKNKKVINVTATDLH